MKILVIGHEATGIVLRKYCPSDIVLDVVPIQKLFCGWDGRSLVLVHADTHQPLVDYDAAYLAGWGKSGSVARFVAYYLAQKKIPAFNVQLFDTWPVTKVAEMCRLPSANITHPKTVCTQDTRNFPALCHWANRHLGFELPLVVKAIGASHGDLNFWIRDERDIVSLDPNVVYLVQEYIPNNGDYRILIVDGKPTVAIWRERKSADTHINNTSKGGIATVVPLDAVDPSVLGIATRAAKAMSRTELAGVDVVLHEQTKVPYVLEVNLCPDIVVGAPDEGDVAVKVSAIFEAVMQRAASPGALLS